jgi:hypothetical protein
LLKIQRRGSNHAEGERKGSKGNSSRSPSQRSRDCCNLVPGVLKNRQELGQLLTISNIIKNIELQKNTSRRKGNMWHSGCLCRPSFKRSVGIIDLQIKVILYMPIEELWEVSVLW